ncbi:hypothetical protein DL238_04685 [Alteriqipengyuania lutimaris]|uniref:Uncharacterized protein n=1 Tax=Alteriqipengyuania lutimaris TaxID=1538146 RepID=A0A395LJ78_9SPHN|nr:hypothetical protein DL238_04685 [Alteriqipengyuania lutimaris]
MGRAPAALASDTMLRTIDHRQMTSAMPTPSSEPWADRPAGATAILPCARYGARFGADLVATGALP